MKKGLMLILGLFILFGFMGVVSAEKSSDELFLFSMQNIPINFNCSTYGVECGVLNFLDGNVNCGTCGSGQACIYGKCTSETLLGKCERLWNYGSCSEIKYEDFIDSTTFYNTCLLNGCENEMVIKNHVGYSTKKCVGEMPSCTSSVEAFCLDRGCEFDPVNIVCVVNESKNLCSSSALFSNFKGSLLNAGTEYCRNQISGCGLSNLGNFETIYFLNDKLYYTKGMDPALQTNNKIYLTHEDLAIIEEGGNVPVYFGIENLIFPEGMPINFNIYAVFHKGEHIGEEGNVEDAGQWPRAEYEAVRAREKAVIAFVNGQGEVNAEWLLSKEDLSLLKFKGKTDIFVKVKANNNILNLGTIEGIDRMYLTLETKTGECSGTPSCIDYSIIACHESEEDGICTWNEETNSCGGGVGIPCESFDEKGFCKFYSCKWKADSIFERFFDWIKSIFGK